MADGIVTRDGRYHVLLRPDDLAQLADLYMGPEAAGRVRGMREEIADLERRGRNDEDALRKILDIADGFDEEAPASLLAKRIESFIDNYTEL